MRQGTLESRSVAFAGEHSTVWQPFFVRPGGVLPKASVASSVMTSLLPAKGWFIQLDELGAVMTDLAITGDEKDILIPNSRLVEKGKALIKAGK